MFPAMSNDGERLALEYLVGKTSVENLVLRLYTNNVTPTGTTVAGDLTEASGSGYSAVTLTGASWTVTEGDPTEAAYATQTFTFSGALGNVYGWYMTRATGGELVYAYLFFNGPFNVTGAADTIAVTPKIQVY